MNTIPNFSVLIDFVNNWQAGSGIRERGGELRVVPIRPTDRETLTNAIIARIALGATIYTDDLTSYDELPEMPYKHDTINNLAREYVNGMAHTNGIDSIWAVLKHGYSGVYYNWNKKHCQRYIDDFVLRLNDGNCQTDTQD